jgi:hypothetical protein
MMSTNMRRTQSHYLSSSFQRTWSAGRVLWSRSVLGEEQEMELQEPDSKRYKQRL